MSDYDVEAVDRLPFTTAEKSSRYCTENYQGAVGLNWYTTDPTDRGPLRDLDADGDEAIERFDDLVAGALAL
jgi:acyl-CoA dehydrogenase